MAESSSSSRSNLVLAGAAITGAIALVAYGVTRPATSTVSHGCDTSAIDEVWSDAQAQAVRDAFATTGSPVADPSFALVRRDLDAYAQTWKAAIEQVCQAQPNPLRAGEDDPRRACLQRRVAGLGAWVTQLREASAQTVHRAPFAIALELAPLADCGLAGERALAAQDDTLQRRLDALDARLQLGDAQAVRAQLEPMASAKPEAGDPGTARILTLLGEAMLQTGDLEAAERVLEQAVWTAIEAGDDPLAMDAALQLSRAVAGRGERFDLAQRWWRLGSALATRMGPSPLRDHALLAAQAELLQTQGHFEAALQIHERALSALEQQLGSEHPALSIGLQGAAESAALSGHGREATALHERADELVHQHLGAAHPRRAAMQRAFGMALIRGGAYELAATYLARSLEGIEDASRDDVQTAIALGRALAMLGEHSASRLAFERAADFYERAGLDDPGLAGDVDLGLGLSNLQSGEPIHALERFQAALLHQREAGDDAAMADTLTRLGKALSELGRVDDGVSALEEAKAMVEASPTATDFDKADAWLALAEGRMQQGRPAQALTLARRALEVWVDAGAEHPGTLDALATIGTAALAVKRPKDAVAAFEQAARLGARLGAPPARRASALLGLATALWRAGQRDEALERIAEVRTLVEEIDDDRVLSAGDVDAWLKRRGLSM